MPDTHPILLENSMHSPYTLRQRKRLVVTERKGGMRTERGVGGDRERWGGGDRERGVTEIKGVRERPLALSAVPLMPPCTNPCLLEGRWK